LQFTPAERKVVIFLVAAFVLGTGVQLYQRIFPSYESFDYTESDARFKALSSAYNESGGTASGATPKTGPAGASGAGGASGTGTASPGSGSGKASTGARSGKSLPVPGSIDINAATIAELTRLPGIGEAIAGRIVEYRERTGGFAAVGDLLKVRGIGEKKLAQIAPYCTVGTPGASDAPQAGARPAGSAAADRPAAPDSSRRP
jgi:competence ComEA-like helix-hairpin-helix protein